jgi:hypothetical protein
MPPQNNLVWGILTTIFCCLPLGIVSIVFAAKVNGQWAMGDYAGAQDSANKAKQYALWGVAAYFILMVPLVLFYIFAFLMAAGASV